MTNRNSNIAMATAAATILLAGMANAPAAFAGDANAAKGHCVGANACKGHGACKGASNACAGQNACKGKGFMSMTKEDCDKIKDAKFEAAQPKV